MARRPGAVSQSVDLDRHPDEAAVGDQGEQLVVGLVPEHSAPPGGLVERPVAHALAVSGADSAKFVRFVECSFGADGDDQHSVS
jgi:hypothetical protein